jgi:hypothetical protein
VPGVSPVRPPSNVITLPLTEDDSSLVKYKATLALASEKTFTISTYTSSWAGDENNIIEDIEFF